MEDSRYASRKFLLAAAAFLAGLGVFLGGLITPDQWLGQVTWILGLYMGANVIQKATAKS